jgi:hypothetical protein
MKKKNNLEEDTIQDARMYSRIPVRYYGGILNQIEITSFLNQVADRWCG